VNDNRLANAVIKNSIQCHQTALFRLTMSRNKKCAPTGTFTARDKNSSFFLFSSYRFFGPLFAMFFFARPSFHSGVRLHSRNFIFLEVDFVTNTNPRRRSDRRVIR
jgi:hypothetical protein